MTSAERVSVERILTQTDFDCFAQLSHDDNPIHVDRDFAAGTRFGRTVAHGMLLNTILRGLLERLVPGGRQESQELMFPAPTFADEPLVFTAELDKSATDTVTVNLCCRRLADDVVTCIGQTTMRRAGMGNDV